QSSALRLPSPHPPANALQIFQGYRSLCALSRLDKLFADRVVDVFGEAALLARHQAQSALGSLGALLLQFGAQPPMPIAYVIDARALVDRTIRVASNVDHAQIHPKHIVYI